MLQCLSLVHDALDCLVVTREATGFARLGEVSSGAKLLSLHAVDTVLVHLIEVLALGGNA